MQPGVGRTADSVSPVNRWEDRGWSLCGHSGIGAKDMVFESWRPSQKLARSMLSGTNPHPNHEIDKPRVSTGWARIHSFTFLGASAEQVIRPATAAAVTRDSLNSTRDLPVIVDTLSSKASEKSLASAARSGSLLPKHALQQVDVGLGPLDERKADRPLNCHEHVSPLSPGFCGKIFTCDLALMPGFG